MRQLYVNGRFLRQPLSGVQRFALEITAGLARIWPDKSQTPILLVPRGPTIRDAPLPVREIGRYQGALWEQLDLASHVGEGILLNLGNTAPLFQKRQALVVHDTGACSTPEAYSRAFVIYYRIMHRWLTRSRTLVLTVSQASLLSIHQYFGHPRLEIGLISEGADHVNRMRADPDTLRRHGLEGTRFVLSVGNLAAHKNLTALTELAQRLERRGVRLVITGQLGVGVFQSKGVRLPEPAFYIGRVSDVELKALYEAAACFVFPSRYEGFGLPAVEAMACGCPAVVSSIPALQEICADAALFANPHSPSDIARAVERILDEPELAARLRHDGPVQASRFTWERAARLLVDALLPLADDNSKTVPTSRKGPT